ncbi:MAG TPA: ribonuclease J [bacterium]|nr:ribonuclease J [bacterium]
MSPEQPNRTTVPDDQRVRSRRRRRHRTPAGDRGAVPQRQTSAPRAPQRRPSPGPVLEVIPLGGLGEIGKNCTIVRVGRDCLLIDAGLMFPDEEDLGIDFVIPDYRAFEQAGTIHGVVLSHGHEDHVGSLPYLLRAASVPVYGMPLTLGLARRRVEETPDTPAMRAVPCETRRPFRVGPFDVELVHVNHSIPQACAVVVRTPAGTLVSSADFKFDQTPIGEPPTDFARLAEIGEAGVRLLLMDSTNVERPGYAPSERVVGAALDEIVGRARGRVLLTTFASNVHRLQQAFETAGRHGRKVAVVGRSMVDTVQIASELGVLRIPRGAMVPVEHLKSLADAHVMILTTGSQGEPMSALSRMATGQHRSVAVRAGDTVILAATPIPGNEGMVARTIDQLYRQGAEVLHGGPVHASGHACQEELKLMLTLLKPRCFLPVHGEYRHLVLNRRLASSVGVPEERSLVAENGQVVAASADRLIRAGTVDAGSVLVDGLGGVGPIVLRDRRQLAKDGVLIALVAIDRQTGELLMPPDIVSRGFIYVRESGELIEDSKKRIVETVARCRERGTTEWAAVRSAIREALGRYLFEKTHRQPMILPMLVEV